MGIKGLEAQLARIQSDGTLVGIEGLEAQFARARGNLSDGSDQTFGSDQEFGEHSQRLFKKHCARPALLMIAIYIV